MVNNYKRREEPLLIKRLVKIYKLGLKDGLKPEVSSYGNQKRPMWHVVLYKYSYNY
jgi:hypothetical protein